jgi:hypothetical protein
MYIFHTDIVEYGTISQRGWRLDLLALVVPYVTTYIVEYLARGARWSAYGSDIMTCRVLNNVGPPWCAAIPLHIL